MLMYPREQQVWVVNLTDDSERFGIALCTVHADRVSVPGGWELHDDREPEPPLLEVHVVEAGAREVTEVVPEATTVQPSEVADAGPAASEPGAAVATTLWGTTDSHTPLLSRAFRAAGVGD